MRGFFLEVIAWIRVHPPGGHHRICTGARCRRRPVRQSWLAQAPTRACRP